MFISMQVKVVIKVRKRIRVKNVKKVTFKVMPYSMTNLSPNHNYKSSSIAVYEGMYQKMF